MVARLRLGLLVALALMLGGCLTDATAAPTESDAPTASSQPTPTASPGPTSTATASVPVAAGWQLTELAGDSPQSWLRAVAAGSDRLVAVGERDCPANGEVCYGSILTSTDGRAFSVVAVGPGLEVGAGYFTSGPNPGFEAIAAGPGGFVVVGYVSVGTPDAIRVEAGVWRSDDGLAWERVDTGLQFVGARPATIVAGGPGYVVVGASVDGETPRAAVWTSPDGRVWTRTPDQASFDVGGYIDTMEAPAFGGMVDAVAFGDQLIAVGKWCAGGTPGGPCRPVIWRSVDSVVWTQDELGSAPASGVLSSVAASGDWVVAVGWPEGSDPSVGFSVRSSDAGSWSATAVDSAALREEVIAVPGGFVGLTTAGGRLGMWVSADGEAWREIAGVPQVAGASVIDAVDATVYGDSLIVVGWVERNGSPGVVGFVLTGDIGLLAP